MNEINSDLSSSNLVILKNKNFSQNYSLLSPTNLTQTFIS